MTYIGTSFLEAGASIEVEICGGDHHCHGHVCICPDSSTHTKLYECSEETQTRPLDRLENRDAGTAEVNAGASRFSCLLLARLREKGEHEHKWISAKCILTDYLDIPESKLLQIEARNRNARPVPRADLLELARDTEIAWQRQVEACVRNNIPVLDGRGRYSQIAKAEDRVMEFTTNHTH